MRCVSKLHCGQTSGAAFGERYRHINGVLIETAQKVGIDLWTLDVLWWRQGQADGPAVDFDDSDDEEGATEPGARFGLWRRLNRPTLGWTAAPRSFTRWRRARPMCMTRPAWGSCCTVKRPGSGATRPIRDKERSFATAPPQRPGYDPPALLAQRRGRRAGAGEEPGEVEGAGQGRASVSGHQAHVRYRKDTLPGAGQELEPAVRHVRTDELVPLAAAIVVHHIVPERRERCQDA